MSGHVGFMVDKVALWQVVSEYFGFHRQFSLHRLLHTHPSVGAGTIGSVVIGVSSELSCPNARIKKAAIKTAQGLVPILLHGPHYSNADRLVMSAVFRSEEDHRTFIRVHKKYFKFMKHATLYYCILRGSVVG
jgi:hypothetical protein